MKKTEDENYVFQELQGKELEQTLGGVNFPGNKYFDAIIRIICSLTGSII